MTLNIMGTIGIVLRETKVAKSFIMLTIAGRANLRMILKMLLLCLLFIFSVSPIFS